MAAFLSLSLTSVLGIEGAPQLSDDDTSRTIVGGRFDLIIDIEDKFRHVVKTIFQQPDNLFC